MYQLIPSLDFHKTSLTDPALSYICNLTKLKSLSLEGCQFKGNGLQFVSTNIEILKLSFCELSEFRYLTKLTNLKELEFAGCYLQQFDNISRLQGIQHLDLRRAKFGPGIVHDLRAFIIW